MLAQMFHICGIFKSWAHRMQKFLLQIFKTIFIIFHILPISAVISFWFWNWLFSNKVYGADLIKRSKRQLWIKTIYMKQLLLATYDPLSPSKAPGKSRKRNKVGPVSKRGSHNLVESRYTWYKCKEINKDWQ